MNTIRILVNKDVIIEGMERSTASVSLTCRADVYFQMTVLYGCSFVNGCDIDIQLMSCLPIYCDHFRMRNEAHAIRKPAYEVHFKGNIWSYIARYMIVGLYLLPDRLTAQQYRDFLKVVLPDLLVEVLLNVRASLNETNPLKERGLTWVADWMISPVT